MPNFKDQVMKDLDVFINSNEHAEVHFVNEKEMSIIIDEDMTKERDRQPIDLYNSANGVYKADLTIYVKASDLGDRPSIGQHFTIDDDFYRVSDCSHSAGMYRITLEVYDA